MTAILTNIWLAAAISGLVGLLLSLPALYQEWREHGKHHDLPILIDIKPRFGKHLTHRELVFVSFLIHILFSAFFGLAYALLVHFAWTPVFGAPFSFASLMVYAVLVWIVNGAILFPLIGFGLFGKKEDDFAWLEILVTQLVLAFGLWIAVQFYQPFYF